MTRSTNELYLTAGDCFDLDITYRAAGVLVNLTGYTAAMAISWPAGFTGRRGAYDSVSWPAGSVELPGAIDAIAGRVAFHLESGDTAALPHFGEALYQVRLKDPSGHVCTVLGGKVRMYRNLFGGS